LEGESENYNKNLPFEEQLLLFSSLGTCYDKSDPREKYENTSHSLRKFCIVMKGFGKIYEESIGNRYLIYFGRE
jgi:hypothetical protein